MTPITAYCSPWHASRSPAFRDQLVEPLKPLLDVRLVPLDSSAVAACMVHPEVPRVFCQVAPPPDLLANPRARVVWIPNWDDLWQWTQWDWNNLPKSLRVVAFSDAVARCAETAGLPTLRVRYCKDPRHYVEVRWDHGIVVYYWNRTGLLNPPRLARMCAAFGANRLIFRGDTDPALDGAAGYDLPSRLGSTEVVKLSGWMDREAYVAAIAEANVVVSPRAREGVGMLMLEAMARGCAVIGLDAATMNEYIVHGRNGLLLTAGREPAACRFLRRARNAVRRRTGRPVIWFREGIAKHDNIETFSGHDLRALGDRARADQTTGHAVWQSQLAELASFLSEWP